MTEINQQNGAEPMKITCTLTDIIEADDTQEAKRQFLANVKDGFYSEDDIEADIETDVP